MSNSITMTGVTGDPTLARLILDSTTTHSRLDKLTDQASTGLIADNYAGLGTGASVSLDLRPQIANLQSWQNNVDAATGRMSVAQSALTGLQSIAANFYAQLNNVQSVNASEVDSIAASARDALRQVAGLLDTQDGGIYVFAGQDTGNPPVPAPDSILTSGFYTQINAAVGNLAINGSAATANTTYDVATSNAAGTSPFSAWLSQPSATLQADPPVVQVGQNQTEPVGIPASANGLIPDSVSTGNTIVGGPPSTTGSYMRDVLRALATIGSLSSSQANAPGFDDLMQDTRISLSQATSAMAQDAGVLGNVQSSLTATQTRLADTQTALTGQVTPAEDVDMAATLSKLSLVQTQMQASYQLIATLGGMSLVKFLPVG
ncbi:MAG TPA: flagellin [Acetobacteraceae bacterium]|jgi:flagellin-like hook-associated protein FlgL